MGPLLLGFTNFFLSFSRGEKPPITTLFSGFNRFGESFVAYLLISVFTFLWTLLLIIPGIIAALSYSQTFYIPSDNHNISSTDAINESKRIMVGNKWKYFFLNLRFFGWAILCVISLGIGFLWLWPYMSVSHAKFYDDVKEKEIGTAAYA